MAHSERAKSREVAAVQPRHEAMKIRDICIGKRHALGPMGSAASASSAGGGWPVRRVRTRDA
jgi:hypothetical protein